MGLRDMVRSYLQEDESTQSEQLEDLTRQRREDIFGDLPEEIEEMAPEDVADTFAQMDQKVRLSFVREEKISQEKWDEMWSMIQNNAKQREFWGLDGTQTVFQEGVEVCACHGEGLSPLTETREVQETIGQTHGESEASKTEVGGKVGGSGGVGIPGAGNVNMTSEGSAKRGQTQGETQQEMAQITETKSTTRTVYACRVEPTNSTISRRAFLQVGKFHIGRNNNINRRDTQDVVDNWSSNTKSTSTQQEQSQKGIDTLREERDDLDDQIEELDEEIVVVNNRLEENDEFLEQNKEDIEKGEGSIERREYFLDERDRLIEKRSNIREQKSDLRTQKSEFQSRIEEHEDYEETQEEPDTAASATQDPDENTTETPAANEDEEVANKPTDSDIAHNGTGDGAGTDSEQTTETDTTEQTDGSDTPDSDETSPTENESGDAGTERETDTIEASTTDESNAEPAQATDSDHDADISPESNGQQPAEDEVTVFTHQGTREQDVETVAAAHGDTEPAAEDAVDIFTHTESGQDLDDIADSTEQDTEQDDSRSNDDRDEEHDNTENDDGENDDEKAHDDTENDDTDNPNFTL